MTSLGQLEGAAILCGAGGELAVPIMQAAGFHSHYADAIAALRRDLGPPVFDSALARGAAMSYEQVAAYFLSELSRIRNSMVISPGAQG
jgi:hypothetical protein